MSLKQSKTENRAIIEEHNNAHMAHKMAIHNQVKNSERDLKERRRREAEEKA